MPLLLHFLRHGQTQHSRDNLYCGGDVDAPLTPEGHAMARSFAQAYQKTTWSAIYASPLQRAQDTARPMQALSGVGVQVREELREIRYGAWDGRSVEDVTRQDADAYRRWLADPGWHPPTGGETAFDLASRALQLVREICRSHAAGNVLLVSHKATIRAVLCSILGIEVSQFRYRLGCPVASVSVVEITGHGGLLHRLADTAHLEAKLRELAGT
jgi:broad specificity phosphatase PhoE